MRLVALALALSLLACAPEAETPAEPQRVAMSAEARATMERVNAARFTAPATAELRETRAGPGGAAPEAAAPAPGVRYDE